jgi:hypothetical protein
MFQFKKLLSFTFIASLLISIVLGSTSVVKADAFTEDGNLHVTNYIPIKIDEYNKEPDFIKQLSPMDKANIIKEIELLEYASSLSDIIKSEGVEIGGIYYDETSKQLVLQIISEEQKYDLQKFVNGYDNVKFQLVKFS